jgi:spore coat polysaccharide biosynthesis protein SpsF (cytidylyltransferase family)
MIGIIAARVGSGRLPGKVLFPLGGKPILQHLIERVKEAPIFEKIVVATSEDPKNEPILAVAEHCGVEAFSGDEEDVASRYAEIVRRWDAENCVRFCADNPLTDMETAAGLARVHLDRSSDYTCIKGLQQQLGMTEALSRHAVELAFAESRNRESFTIFLRENVHRIKVVAVQPDPFLHQSPYRLTIDYDEDYTFLKAVFAGLDDGRSIPFRSVMEFLREHPEVADLNSTIDQSKTQRYWEELDSNLPEAVPMASLES